VIAAGDVLELLGAEPEPCGAADRGTAVERPASLGTATSGSVTFCTAKAADAAEKVRATEASVVVVDDAVADALADGPAVGSVVVRSANARMDFMRVLSAFFASPPPEPGIHPTAAVAEGAQIAASAHIGANCTIAADVTIGDGTVLHPGVHVQAGTRIGARVTIHPGTVIGADGFGFERDASGQLVRFPHVGGVVIEDGAEIGANVCIDRGAIEDTWIGPDVKIANLAQIAHNVRLGAETFVIVHAAMCGSSSTGERAWIAPCACVRDHVHVGSDATVGLGAVVTSDVPDGATVVGNPGRDMATYRAMQAQLKKLAAGE
jgi:UDP-3-O-[3-hydroxymyristoyl] glucosamine N-acyltransferase